MLNSRSISYKAILVMSLCFVTISSSVSSVQRRSQRQSDYRNYGTDSGWTAANIGGISSYPVNDLNSVSPTAFQPQNPAKIPYNNYPNSYDRTGRSQNDVNQYGQGYYGRYGMANQRRYGHMGGSSWRGFGGGKYPYGARSYPDSQQGVKY